MSRKDDVTPKMTRGEGSDSDGWERLRSASSRTDYRSVGIRARDDRDGPKRDSDGRYVATSCRRESDGSTHRRTEEGRQSSRSREISRHKDRHTRSREMYRDGDGQEHRSKEISRSRSRSRDSHRPKRRHKRYYDSDSSDSSISSTERQRRKRRDERRREEREERKRRKELKRVEEEESSTNQSSTNQRPKISWGKYGIISEADMHTKDQEFRSWLIEERRLNPDRIPRDKIKKEFKVYVEDYNTGTLSHEKYYDMEKYKIQMDMVKSGYALPIDERGYDPFEDLKAHNKRVKAEKGKRHILSREEVQDLRRVEKERIEIGRMRLLGIDVPRDMGVRADYLEVEKVNFDDAQPLTNKI